MNDSLRTDVFVRYPPETIAVACIYLSARKLKEPLPKNPSWFEVLGVEEDDIKDCCYRMICLYNREKANQEDLERTVKSLREKRRLEKEARDAANASALNTPSQSSPNSRAVSPVNSDKGINGTTDRKNGKETNNDENVHGDHNTSPVTTSRHKKKHKHKAANRSRSRSPSYDDYKRKKSKKRSSRTPSLSPGPIHKKSKHERRGHHRDHHHKEKVRYRSRSRDRDYGRRGGVASIGLNDEKRSNDRDNRDRYDRKGRDYRR